MLGTRHNNKVKDIAKAQRDFPDQEAKLRNEIIQVDVKSHGNVMAAQAAVQGLQNQVETLQTTNESLDKQLQQLKT